ncbi:MAG: gliding motility protein GldL [Verrucomicrobia bacterium]|nr:gliding motility protein GldL [Cytophagales bacterium]
MAQKVSFLWDRLIPMFYGIGAAIVIIGALFKLQHWEGAGTLLQIGLFTEAAIFAISGIKDFVLPATKEPAWEKVYPELAYDYEGPRTFDNLQIGGGAKMPTLPPKTAEAFEALTPDIVERLGKSMLNLSDNVGKMTSFSDASVATNEYATAIKSASGKIQDLNKSYEVTVSAMQGMADASADAKAYHAQVQSITKNLGALNAVYEMELQDTNKHLKAMNAFYGSLTTAMENMAEASKDTQEFKNQLGGLTMNLTSLNKVYGSMLTAMRGQ